jgi:hypothetical protein
VPTGVHVKLLGWIKSAVELVKPSAGPRKVEPPPQAPPATDSHAVPEDVGAHTAAASTGEMDTVEVDIDNLENRTERPVDVAPQGPISVEVEAQVESETPTSAEPETPPVEPESPTVVDIEGTPSQQEIDRRRGMVRAFFNDYWSSADDKPPSFAERLDRAESYINERVAAGGEAWRLGPATRKQLGLPPSGKR